MVNGEYYVDGDPRKTLAHYGAFRRVDLAGLRRLYEQAKALPLAQATAGSPRLPGAGRAVVWTLDSLTTTGGYAVTMVGTPRLVETEIGKAVEFNDKTDGLFLDVNPLAGLERATIEVVFAPAAGGPRRAAVRALRRGRHRQPRARRAPDAAGRVVVSRQLSSVGTPLLAGRTAASVQGVVAMGRAPGTRPQRLGDASEDMSAPAHGACHAQ